MNINTIFIECTAFIGVISFTLNGVISAKRQNLGIISSLIITFVTTTGGGIVRDIITLNTPQIIHHTTYQVTILSVFILSLIFKLYKKNSIETKLIFVLSDISGTVVFAVYGAAAALESNFGLFGTVFLSFVSGFGGTIIRDLLLHKQPIVLKNDLFIFIILMMGLLIYLFSLYRLLNLLSISILIITAIVFKLIFYFKISKNSITQ